MWKALSQHWPEYLMEAVGLGLFMISAVVCATILEHPSSPVRQLIADATARRVLIGVGMGLTAIAIIYSPWGAQSGAHLNPSVSLTFLRLGKIKAADALFYVLAQFVGGIAGVAMGAALVNGRAADSSVHYVVTQPRPGGTVAAFLAELAIAFVLMTVVLSSSSHPRLQRFTGLFAGTLVALYISIEAPLSGMSMNPARSFGSALIAGDLGGLWIYFTAPIVGMLFAAQLHVLRSLKPASLCAKLHHAKSKRCIFCGKPAAVATPDAPGAVPRRSAFPIDSTSLSSTRSVAKSTK
jgi:aquaporin Z